MSRAATHTNATAHTDATTHFVARTVSSYYGVTRTHDNGLRINIDFLSYAAALLSKEHFQAWSWKLFIPDDHREAGIIVANRRLARLHSVIGPVSHSIFSDLNDSTLGCKEDRPRLANWCQLSFRSLIESNRPG